MNEAIELLKQLIQISSVSGNEKGIGEFVAKRLEKNFKVEKQIVKGDRFNVFAYCGEPKILLTAHLDTVPGEVRFTETDDKIFGRGACDTKASVATMIVAAEKAKQAGLKDFALLLDVGEETDFCGVKVAIKKVKPQFAIVGEPSELKSIPAQKGLLGFKLTAKGKAAHGARPDEGINAIEKLMEVIQALKTLEVNDGTTINIGQIFGGKASNVVPDYAQAVIEYRLIWEDSDLIEKIKKKVAVFDNIELEIDYNYGPKKLTNEKIVKALEEIGIKTDSVKPGFTELYFYDQAIILGPGNSRYAHKDNEQIKKQQVIDAVDIYVKLIEHISKTI